VLPGLRQRALGRLDSTNAILEGAALFNSFDGSSWLTNAANFNTSFAPTWSLQLPARCDG